ncbi:CPBP family intramembrane glutamic endopeptidase [uncultured Caulobacter sp.]|uniref:CPBP family intramembrane glutamic endopeptidase n=1 Tax=uncultured Caulobacter sp. TaxID=158749 RepID=UPI002628D436|nr:CPBP family intramembrane glutamic endopeptidase [uncultured Caulobacter sp.]
MGELMEAVKRSRFLADLSPYDRDPWRTAFAVPVGMLAGAVAAVLGGASAILLAVLVVSGLDGAPAVGELFAVFSDPNLTEPTARQSMFILAVLAGVNLGLAVGFVVAAGAIHHRRITDYVNGGEPMRPRLLLGGLVVVGVVMGAVVAAAALLGQPIDPPLWKVAPNLVGRALYAVLAMGLLVLAAAAEELLFRGWLLKQSAAYVRDPIVLMLLNGLLFAAIHVDPNIDAFLVRAAMGMGLTWMALRLGGIELGIGAHAANNAVILLLIRPMTTRPDAPHEFKAGLIASALVVLAGFIGVAELSLRWPALRRWTRGGAPAAA